MLLSSFRKKSVPEEVLLVPIKRPSYAPASALVFLNAFSLFPFGSKEPFIEENHFNVSFDVTAAVTFFLYYFQNHGMAYKTIRYPRIIRVYILLSGSCLWYLLTVRSIFMKCYDFSRKMKDSYMRHMALMKKTLQRVSEEYFEYRGNVS